MRVQGIILISLVLSACHKTDLENQIIRAYEDIHINTKHKDAFLYFTDPHISPNDASFNNYINTLHNYYSESSTEFCLCGGDWLNNMDTQVEAKDKLRAINSVTNDIFDNRFYHVLGNHDTNYQGRLNESSVKNTGQLSQADIIESLYPKQKQSFFSFKTNESKFIILNTGIDWDYNIDNLRLAQINWFANELQNNEKNHIVILLHIYTNDLINPHPFSEKIMNISEAFNYRLKYSINNKTYDFKYSTGKIACFICGHCHIDFVDNNTSIPVVGTSHLKDGEIPTFDLCLIDWDKNTLNMIRVGTGYSRVINLAEYD